MAIVGPGNSTSYVATPFSMTRTGFKTITIFHWLRSINSNGAAAFAGSGAGFFNSTNNYEFHTIYVNTEWYADEEDSTGADFYATFGGTMTPFVWYPFMICAKADGTRYGRNPANGAIVADTNVAAGGTAFTHFGLGYTPAVDSANGFLWDSNTAIGELAVWYGELQLGDWQALRSGVNPASIRRDILWFYYPLRDDLVDRGPTASSMRPYGTSPNYVWSEHPPVQSMPRRRRSFPGTQVTITPSVYMTYPW